MSVGLLAILDDVTAATKAIAASIDDIAAQATKASAKAAGVVIDDAAVTPRYVVGFAADRELPIVRKIARGSLRNKLLFLLPAALLLSAFAPWLITPLLTLGGIYLCYEGTEKVFEALFPHRAHAHEEHLPSVAPSAETVEDMRVAGAIKTDFILSAEIMAIALAAIDPGGFWMQAAVLAVVAVGITVAIYGAVALIVKADDAGAALIANGSMPATRALGRLIVAGMPYFLRALSVVGTAAMIWVGGSLVVHGMEAFGLASVPHAIHDAAVAAAALIPAAAAAVEWLVSAAGYGLVGLVVGAAAIPAAEYLLAPAWARLSALVRRAG